MVVSGTQVHGKNSCEFYIPDTNSVRNSWKPGFGISLPVEDHGQLIGCDEESPVWKFEHYRIVVCIEGVSQELYKDNWIS